MSLLDSFSIQLYTLKEETQQDFPRTLRKLSEIGYTGVEFAGYGGLPAAQMKALLSECGLVSVGSHIGIERLESALEEELAYNREIGTQYIVVPYFKMESAADAEDLANRLRALSPKIKEAGFGFAYHNHAHEFAKHGTDYLMDITLSHVPADELDMELDIYWAAYAGIDYMSWMRENVSRVKLLHLKQIKDMESKECVDLGEGAIDFNEIIKLGKEIGVKSYILEQEDFAESPQISVKNGFDYIMSL